MIPLLLLSTLLLATDPPPADPAEVLTKRTYAMAPVSDDLLVRATSFGVLLESLDATNKATRKGALKLKGSINDLAVFHFMDAVRIYAAGGPNGLHVIAPGGPEGLQLVGHMNLSAAVMRLRAEGNRLYAGLGTMGVAVLEIAPTNERLVARHNIPHAYCRDVAPFGKGLLVAADDIYLIDRADRPKSPHRGLGLSQVETIHVINKTTIAAGAGKNLIILDLSSKKPTTLATLPFKDRIHHVTAGPPNQLLIAAGAAGAALINITNPKNPTILRQIRTPASANRALYHNKKIHIAADSKGLFITE